jgi:Zn-dependent protease
VTTPIEGGRPLLRARLFGFPVHLDLSFVVVMAFLGYYPGVSVTDMALWLLITPVAVLVHELGHAFTARAAGAQPQIALAGFGGVTTFVPPGPLSRVRSLGISLAGPAVGLAVGAVLVLVNRSFGDGLDPTGWQSSALRAGIWTCLGWSVLNLLPVLPLDGGQAMRELLPGAPERRARRAAGVSLVVAGLAAVVAAVVLGQVFLAIFMVFFAVTNALSLRRPPTPPPDATVQTPEQAVVGLLWVGEPERARDLLAARPPGTMVDPAVHGAVLALTGDPAQGRALLAQEIARRPGDPNVAAMLLLTLTMQHDWDALIAALQSPVGVAVPPAVVLRAMAEARATGREDVARRITLLIARPERPGS